MEIYFLWAAIVSVLVGAVHSFLGELLIFRKLRKSGVVPTEAVPPVRSRNTRILWATWHLASVFGFGFAAILFAAATGQAVLHPTTIYAVIWSFFGGSMLVLFATKGKHPGWVGLILVAALVYLGNAT